MKHQHFTIFSLVAILATMFLASCTGPMGPQGPAGRDGRDGHANISTIDIEVREFRGRDEDGVWQYDPVGKYYYAHVPVKQLTRDIYDYGTISCYREYYPGTNQAYQISLPEVQHLLDYDANVYYTQTIDYSFGFDRDGGFVEIVLTTSDHFYAYDYEPETMFFRVNMLW